MIKEDEFPLEQKSIIIFESFLNQGNQTLELDNDITITYSGGKDTETTNKIKNILIQSEINKNIDFSSIQINKEDDNNDDDGIGTITNLFSIKYNDIYIGGISPNFLMREGLGLNKYSEETFYIGEWKNNMKEGLGFLKIDNNNFYIGYFHQNQLDGDGILYLKTRNIFFIGHLSNGEYDEGAYLDLNKDIYYRGKFKEGKKNDDHCTMIEMKNKHIFVGKVTDDVFERGYLCSFNTEELNVKDENDKDMPVTQFNMEKIFYFYKDKDENKQFVYQYQKDFKEILNDNFRKIFELETQTKKFYENNVLNYIEYCCTLEEDNDFNDLLRYNDKGNGGLSVIFFSNYNFYINEYKDILEEFDINDIKNKISISQELFESQNE